MEPACFDGNCGVSSKKNSKSISSQTSIANSDNNGCFECNICLESACDPVVTLCGHLYCWPCIFQWLQVHNFSSDDDESDRLQPTCPVCKAGLSHTSLVPLYGRGGTHSSDSELNKTNTDIGIPPRPPPQGLNTMLNSTSGYTSQRYLPRLYGGYAVIRSPYLGVSALTSFCYPIMDMLREMVFAGTFRSSESNSLANRYVGYYPHNVGSDSHRMRRQEMLIDKSLSRVSFFLLCCVILCLLLF